MSALQHLPFEAYAALKAENWSHLKLLLESPQRYRMAKEEPPPDRVTLLLGRLRHALVFEPDTVDRDYAVFEGERRAGKAWEAFKLETFGRAIVRRDEFDEARAFAAAVRAHPLVRPYLEDAVFEQSVTWTDPTSSLPCKARLDWLQGRTLLDLKTTSTIDMFRFGRIAARLAYHGQLAHYEAGVQHALGWVPEKVAVVAAESKPPYDVGVFILDDDARAAGRQLVDELLAKLLACHHFGTWPGRYVDEVFLRFPPYIYGDDEEHDDAETLGVTAAGDDSKWTFDPALF